MGESDFSVWSPKVGVLWEVDAQWQVYANAARSAEFRREQLCVGLGLDAKLQTATTYEIGTRGRRPDLTWDVALYRMNINTSYVMFDPLAPPSQLFMAPLPTNEAKSPRGLTLFPLQQRSPHYVRRTMKEFRGQAFRQWRELTAAV